MAVASVPGPDGVIHACVELSGGLPAGGPVGNLRVIDPAAHQHCDTTTTIGWAGPTEQPLSWENF
jgi:hypothetical protein